MADFHDIKLMSTVHAMKMLAERNITEEAVDEAVRNGEVIEDYPDAFPMPACLILHHVNGVPIHVVIGYNVSDNTGSLVTAYEPSTDKWLPGFRQRR